MELNKAEIEALERKYRLNLINSLSGIKSANLIASRSKSKQDNVAIFSSVVHLGSHPAQLGFIMRPQNNKARDTYLNILETEFYTINHVSESFVKKAHYTSAKLEFGDSEFERMNLTKEFIPDFYAPFVKESAVKIAMKHLESIPLPNGCIFIIGSIESIILADGIVNDLGQIDLEKYACMGISGLNTYYSFTKKAIFPYVRIDEIPEFE